jgi:excinuclease ABC subunit A
MKKEYIEIKGAREHNLKNIDINIPRDKFVVITGLSGSGKSSLAFDTIFAEGQRRYVESLSAYARQFLGQMEKPDVDYIEGLSPAISIDQKTTSRNPRSTVGTVTEVYDYLRLLYARIGTPHCVECGKVISSQTVDQMVDEVMKLEDRSKIQILSPIVRGRKGEHVKTIEDLKRGGFVRIKINGEDFEVTDDIKLDKNKKHNIDVVVDRIIKKEGIEKRLSDSIETALNLANGIVKFDVNGEKVLTFSQHYACNSCGISLEEISPRMFSFNSPFGACSDCAGIGSLMNIDPDLVIEDENLSLNQGAIKVSGWNIENEDGYARMYFDALAKEYNFDLKTPLKDLSSDVMDVILYGTKGKKLKVKYEREHGKGEFSTTFEGIVNSTQRRYKETHSEGMKKYYEGFMSTNPCPKCNGTRLKEQSLAITINDKNINELTAMSVVNLRDFFLDIKLTDREKLIVHQVLKEINERLSFLVNVGLDYLSLSRTAATLSGGEAQRIRLATQIGSGLTGVLYILDEPSIGLHQRDNERLLVTLKRLRDLGNTLVVVEHDEDTMYAADHIIDMGPGAGDHGGEVVAQGTVEDIRIESKSITGQYLIGKEKILVPEKRRKPSKKYIKIVGACENNLKNVTAKIPVGVFTSITGVSGSGKSSLINEILYKASAEKLNRAKMKPGKFKEIKGLEYLDKVIDIDQSPIGRTPRSNPATYTGVFDYIRQLFSETSEAKFRGYKQGRFSFNVKGGRCEACSGDGIIKIEMHFLPDVYVPCESCKGKRYNRDTLDVAYKGKNISQVLDMTVEEAEEFFKNIPRIQRKLQTLVDVGLSYIRLGQPSTTLSGGEAQRIKLASELSKRSTGKTLYILDEPTTGLHIADVHKLISILQRLTDGGNTVVVIEHNLEVIKVSDYIIDLGPEGGDKGGYIVAEGSPEKVAKSNDSHTGRFLQKML